MNIKQAGNYQAFLNSSLNVKILIKAILSMSNRRFSERSWQKVFYFHKTRFVRDLRLESQNIIMGTKKSDLLTFNSQIMIKLKE